MPPTAFLTMTDDRPQADEETALVRPYIITGGETAASGDDLPIETLVSLAPGISTAPLDLERRDIAALCAEPLSIAEIATALDLPLGVVRFLASDLAADGYLVAHRAGTGSDADLLRALIDGIRAL